jgi:hypothetical protein
LGSPEGYERLIKVILTRRLGPQQGGEAEPLGQRRGAAVSGPLLVPQPSVDRDGTVLVEEDGGRANLTA